MGGVAYKEEVIVLEETPDKKWQRIRLPDGDIQGWIKGGNVESMGEGTENQTNNKTPETNPEKNSEKPNEPSPEEKNQ